MRIRIIQRDDENDQEGQIRKAKSGNAESDEICPVTAGAEQTEQKENEKIKLKTETSDIEPENRTSRSRKPNLRHLPNKKSDDKQTKMDPKESIETLGVKEAKMRRVPIGALFCICQKEWEDGVQYIGCDFCENWFHPQCVGLPPNVEGIELYKCPSCMKNKVNKRKELHPSETKSKKDEEMERDRAELKTLKDELEKTKSENKDLNEKMVKKQKNLDCLSNQHSKIKKEANSSKNRLEIAEKTIQNLENRATELTKKNQQLNSENKAHEEFAKNNLNTEALSSELKERQKENEELREAITAKDISMKSMQDQIDNMTNPKTAASTQHINRLKTQVDSMETEVNHLRSEIDRLQNLLDVARADHNREKELNTLLVRKALAIEESTSKIKDVKPIEIQPANEQEESKRIAKDRTDHTEFENEDQRERDFCINEFFVPGSCTYRRCMFKHVITDENRQDQRNIDRLQRKSREIEARREFKAEKGAGPSVPNQKEICLTAFRNGENSCRAECPHEHNLDYQRIKKGICYFYISGTCHRDDKCWFSHEIPASIKTKPEVVKAATEFVKRMKDKKLAGRIERAENIENDNRQRKSESTSLDKEEKYEQQSIRSSSTDSQHQSSLAETMQTSAEEKSVNQAARNDSRIPPEQQPTSSKSKNAVPKANSEQILLNAVTNEPTMTARPVQYQPTMTTTYNQHHPTMTTTRVQHQPAVTTPHVQHEIHPLHHYQQQNLYGPQNWSGNPQTITYDHFLFLMKHFTQNQSHWFHPNNHQQNCA